MTQQTKCPRCGRIKAVEKLVGMFHCRGCGALFDEDPDEGGIAMHNDPVRAAELKEREERGR